MVICKCTYGPKLTSHVHKRINLQVWYKNCFNVWVCQPDLECAGVKEQCQRSLGEIAVSFLKVSKLVNIPEVG